MSPICGPAKRATSSRPSAIRTGLVSEVQHKLQAEPGEVPGRGEVDGWVGSGWTIFNNKGKPVRQYEPFFTPTHDFEFAAIGGVSSTLFYDPVGRRRDTAPRRHL